jgi:hypothetical protein
MIKVKFKMKIKVTFITFSASTILLDYKLEIMLICITYVRNKVNNHIT